MCCGLLLLCVRMPLFILQKRKEKNAEFFFSSSTILNITHKNEEEEKKTIILQEMTLIPRHIPYTVISTGIDLNI